MFNHGKMQRDFTYIADIVEGVMRVIDRPAIADPLWRGDAPDPATSYAPYRIFNIGNDAPVELSHFIAVLEQCLGRKAKLEMLPMQPGDVLATAANVARLEKHIGFKPATPIETGIAKFVAWYRGYYAA